MSRWTIVLGALLAVGSVWQARAQEPADVDLFQPAEEIVKGELGQKLDALLTECEHFGFNGAVLVANDGEIVLQKGYGFADRAAGRSNTPDTLYDIASTSKQFTAAAILCLEMDGKLSTDDPISKHLPGVGPELDDVTIYHLLTHTAGFRRMGPTGGGPDLERAVAGYLRNTRTRKAGKKFEYHNGGYALLAAIVQRASGMDFREYCRERLFEPAGMHSTGFCRDGRVDQARVAHGYKEGKDIGLATDHSFGWEYRGMGGVVTSVADLFRWHVALQGSAVLNERARRKLFKPFLSNYACGWFVKTTTADYNWAPPNVMWQSHGGTVQGFEIQFWRFPDLDAAIAVLSNDSGSGAAYTIIFNLGGQMLKGVYAFSPPPETVDWAPQRLDALAGAYAFDAGGRLVVERSGAAIEVHALGQRAVDLLAAGRVGNNPDRHNELVALATRIVEALTRGDVEPLRESMMSFIPRDWPDRVGREYWPQHVAKWGELRSFELMGAMDVGPGRVRVLLMLEHERATRPLKIVFQNGKLNIFDLWTDVATGRTRFRPMPDGVFVTYTFRLVRRRGPGLVFDVNDQGEAESVRLITEGGEFTARRVENGAD